MTTTKIKTENKNKNESKNKTLDLGRDGDLDRQDKRSQHKIWGSLGEVNHSYPSWLLSIPLLSVIDYGLSSY
jgi:hypothetical protein